MVADEVRSLSHRIHDETSTINQRIQALQGAALQAVSTIENGGEKAELNQVLVLRAGVTFKAITDSVATINQMNDLIASGTEHETRAITTINQSIGKVNRLARETADSAQVAAAGGNEFMILANQLRDMINKYLIKGEQPGAEDEADQLADNIEIF